MNRQGTVFTVHSIRLTRFTSTSWKLRSPHRTSLSRSRTPFEAPKLLLRLVEASGGIFYVLFELLEQLNRLGVHPSYLIGTVTVAVPLGPGTVPETVPPCGPTVTEPMGWSWPAQAVRVGNTTRIRIIFMMLLCLSQRTPRKPQEPPIAIV